MTILWFLYYTYVLIFNKEAEDESLGVAVIPCLLLDTVIIAVYEIINKYF